MSTDAGTLLAAAIANNVEWCASVSCDTADETAGVWLSGGRPLPLFPDAVTLRPGVPAAQLADALAGRADCSVKDSFADVDLAPFGFRELFAAAWIGRPPVSAVDTPGWSSVTDPAGLTEWCTAAGLPERPPVALLDDPAVRILETGERGRIVGGAIANWSGDAVGLSNVFHPDSGWVWANVVAIAAQHFPGLPLVGYEHGPDLDAAIGAGFRELGALRIWVRG